MRQPEPRERADDPAGTRAGREPQGATFDATRIGGRRQRPPGFVLIFGVLIGGLVALGFAGRNPAGDPGAVESPLASGSRTGTTVAQGSPAGGSPSAPSAPSASPDRAPVVTSGEGPIVITARRHPETMYVHGDVFVDHVTWVFVSLRDRTGRVAGWASVSVPGAAGRGEEDGPSLRFDVELAVPQHLTAGSLWIHANAHDAGGRLMASTELEIDRNGNGPVPAKLGFRPGVYFPLLDANSEDVR